MVEFCGHIIFHNTKLIISCPIQRATQSCVDVGSSVINNICLLYFINNMYYHQKLLYEYPGIVTIVGFLNVYVTSNVNIWIILTLAMLFG